MYSSALGRFLQTDPIGYYDSMNLYQYCGNNPINYLDPTGLCEKSLDEIIKELQDLLEKLKEKEALRKEIEAVKKTIEILKDAQKKGKGLSDIKFEEIGKAGIGPVGAGMDKPPIIQNIINNIEGASVGGLNIVNAVSAAIAAADLLSGKDLDHTMVDVELYRSEAYLEALENEYNKP